jgi:hypothetical protein
LSNSLLNAFGLRSVRFTRTLFAVLSLTVCFAAFAQAQTPETSDSLHTIAGELKIIELEAHCKYKVLLADKIILQTDCQNESNEYYATPEPTIHTYYKSLADVGDFEEVVLFQMQMLGNACDGGDLIFLGLRRNKSSVLSNGIDFCGGRPPVITWGADKVTVLIPGGPPNRGKGYIPPETWVYENGRVKKLKARSPLRRKQSPPD